MKQFALLAILLLALPMMAQVPVPLTSEPYHHLQLQNNYVRVFYVEVPPHKATLMHSHDKPYFYVALGDAKLRNSVLGKDAQEVTLADGQARYSSGNFAHMITNELDTPLRDVAVEFLQPQTKARNLCTEVIEHEPLDCPPFVDPRNTTPPDGGSTTLPIFETGQVRVNMVRMAPSAKTILFRPRYNNLVVVLEGSTLQVATHGQPAEECHAGDLAWLARGNRARISNKSKSVASYLSFEFKSSE
jgi:quercetin dioxygenase-like cupin family protein